MSNDARAATRSATALAGFLVVAGLQLAVVLAVLWTVLKLLPSDFALRAGVPLSLATFGALGYATWRALHSRRRVPAGVAVTRADAPELWALVDGAATAAGVSPPDGLTVVADATVVTGEQTRALGLVGGRRDLYLGLPLLQAWDTARVRAAVAHELAHGSTRLGRWAPAAYRGRVVVGRLASRWGRGRNPVAVVLRAYAEVYRRRDAPFSRAQELAADRIAAEYAGPVAAVAVLRDLPVLAGMQRLFHAEYVGPGWQAGHVPEDVFGGFLRVLAARGEDVAILRARGAEPGGAWDTHPPLAERLAALTPPAPSEEAATDEAPAVEPAPESEETADELVPDLPGLGKALQAVAFPSHGRTEVGWDDFLSVARTAEMEREAEAALATVSRAVGVPVPDAERVLELAADGRLKTAAATIFPGLSPEETADRIVDLLSLMLALAALRSDVARWRHNWTGTAELVARDGNHLNLTDVAAAAADPEQAEAVRAYLTQIGVDLAAPVGDRPAARAQVLGGLVNLSADGGRTDLLVTDLGFLLVPGLARGKGGDAKRRLHQIAATGVPVSSAAPESPEGQTAVATMEAPVDGRRFVPFVDVAAVTALPGRRRGWVLGLHDGGSLTLRSSLDTEELPGGWAAWEDAVTFLAGTR
ncbi:M48 family metallopeptidase [Actinoplanes awajinensis]|uniref:Peptidase n=1 Tax=Actinoplanes awajinensis subsp. mycoplanecinus TaxID=135947 RepID=A0A124G9Y0_9ACTN|nr:M48 family metallopeptidase [Actinoplanes awajinensis]KUL30535.1 peptidase [Actinoplanes awajinensis subsp. mycoplanecinus]